MFVLISAFQGFLGLFGTATNLMFPFDMFK
jgi:hypothetical protein